MSKFDIFIETLPGIIQTRSTNEVKCIIDKFTSIQYPWGINRRDCCGYTILMMVAANDKTGEVIQYQCDKFKKEININIQNDTADTALLFAAERNENLKVIQCLCDTFKNKINSEKTAFPMFMRAVECNPNNIYVKNLEL